MQHRPQRHLSPSAVTQIGIVRPAAHKRLLRPGYDGLRPAVLKRLLVWVDDQMLRILLPPGDKGLTDGQGRTAVSEANFDNDTRTLRQEQVAKGITILMRERDPREITPRIARSDFSQPRRIWSDSREDRSFIWHDKSVSSVISGGSRTIGVVLAAFGPLRKGMVRLAMADGHRATYWAPQVTRHDFAAEAPVA